VTACQRESELLVVDAGRHRGMAVDVDVRCHPDQYSLRPAYFAGQVRDLHQRVDDNPADTHRGGIVEFVERFGVAVHDDSGRIDAAGERGRQLTARADVNACTFLGHPARDGRRQQRLGGIDGFGVAQRGAVPGEPVPKVRLVENVCRCAELVGDVRQRHISHAEAAQVVDARGQRPDGRVYSGRGGVVQGRQIVQQCHKATVRRSPPDGTSLDGVLTRRRQILMRCGQTSLTGSIPRSL